MDDRYIITMYQKIFLSDNILVFKRIGVVANVYINISDELNEVTYYDQLRRRVTLEYMDNPYTFVSDDGFCYGYPILLEELKNMYPDIQDKEELKRKYLSDISEVINIAYYDKEKDAVKIFVTNEEKLKEHDDDELFDDFSISYNSSDEEENIFYSLNYFKKMVQYAQEGKYEKLKEQLLKINRSVDEINRGVSDAFDFDLEKDNSTGSVLESLNKLNRLIGLDNVKLEINKMQKYLLFRDKVENQLKLVEPNLNMFFTGNPGTGKTTVAKIVGELLYHMGYIKRNYVAEITPKDLIAGYVGQTALKTSEFLQKNRGGVIFVDEAYAFAEDAQKYGNEALVEILKELEKRETVFIFAGYKDEMTNFMQMNPGLMSRIGYYLEYKDYTIDELYQIFESKIVDMGFKIDDSLKLKILTHLEQAITSNHFGNGRYIDKLIDKIILEHAINTSQKIKKEELITLTDEDLNDEVESQLVFKTKRKTIGFQLY